MTGARGHELPEQPVGAAEGRLEWDGAPSESQSLGPAFHARTYLIDRVFQRLKPRCLLDIGCGRGHVTAIAARHAERVVGADLAHGAAHATRRALAGHEGADVLVADVFDIEWGQELRRRNTAFDAVLLSEVLEHLDEDLTALIACRELLADDGVLVLTVPGNPALWTAWDDLAGHRRRYTRQELTWKVEAAGFRVRELVNWGFPLTGWLARRGAKMRAERVIQRHPEGEVPGAIGRLLPRAAFLFRAAARVEPLFSWLDWGAGYVVVAERDNGSSSVDSLADAA